LLIVLLMKEQKMLYGQAAAQVTQDTLEAHGVQADIIVTDLVRGLEDQLSGAVDVLLFNPPYVPTPEHEVFQCLPSL
jgi:release factor glutamine methyltransferase